MEYLHITSVDNIMAKLGDPYFLGSTIESKADCANKVVLKVVVVVVVVSFPVQLRGDI